MLKAQGIKAESSQQSLQCYNKGSPECGDGATCECPNDGTSNSCYTLFKIKPPADSVYPLNTTIHDTATIEVTKAGCWHDQGDCSPPVDFLYKTPRINMSKTMLEPSYQSGCFAWSSAVAGTSKSDARPNFCCCRSGSMCNMHIVYFRNETSPYLTYGQSFNPTTPRPPPSSSGSSSQGGGFVTFSSQHVLLGIVALLVLALVLVIALLFAKRRYCQRAAAGNRKSSNFCASFFSSKSHEGGSNSGPNNLENDAEAIPLTVINTSNHNNKDNANTGSNAHAQRRQSPVAADGDAAAAASAARPAVLTGPVPFVNKKPSENFFPQPIIPFEQLNSMPMNRNLTNDNVNIKRYPRFFDQWDTNTSPLLSKDFKMSDNIPQFKLEDIELREQLALGQLSSVWKGAKKGSDGSTEADYAIKIFSEYQKPAWSNESDVYSSLLPTANDNILRFLGIALHNERKECWLVTEYHPAGSLFDYLRANFLTWPQLVTMAQCILDGLAYLHSDNPLSTYGKSFAIAHRDLKSKNILVKGNGQACCIGDFGLALRLDSNNKLSNADIRSKVGTRRYMSPELIEGAINFTKDSFLRIDVYACALVLWELISRGDFYEEKQEYRAPFEEELQVELNVNPPLEEMKRIVVDEGQRPTIPREWRKYYKIDAIARTIEECWDVDLEARLSSECAAGRIRRIYLSLNP